jgi:hypothetical protein
MSSKKDEGTRMKYEKTHPELVEGDLDSHQPNAANTSLVGDSDQIEAFHPGLRLAALTDFTLQPSLESNERSGTSLANTSSLPTLKPFVGVRTHKPVKQRGTKFVRTSRLGTVLGLTTCFAGAAALMAGGLFIDPLTQVQPVRAQTIFENVTIQPNFSPDPMVIKGISGGSVPATQVADRKETPTGPCVGFVDESPDHTISLTAFFNYLSLQVDSPQDTTLVVSGPGGTWCNDDFQGKNPGIAGQWQAGTYKVWVGSYDKNNYNPYIIKVSQVQLLNPGPFRR